MLSTWKYSILSAEVKLNCVQLKTIAIFLFYIILACSEQYIFIAFIIRLCNEKGNTELMFFISFLSLSNGFSYKTRTIESFTARKVALVKIELNCWSIESNLFQLNYFEYKTRQKCLRYFIYLISVQSSSVYLDSLCR